MLLRVILVLVTAYGGLCLLVFLAQRRLLYFPQRQSLEEALQEAALRQLEPWRDEAGNLLGWWAPHRSRAPEGTLLVLHGNAGSALDRTYFRDAFQAQGLTVALDLVLLEYPGYGPRGGTPSEAALVGAAQEAIDRLDQASRKPVFLAGESLGAAVAALAAARRPQKVKGLLLLTPLKSVPAVARRHYPLLPAVLVRDAFRADRALADLRMPIAFLIAGRDEVVFPDLGQQLAESYRGPKRLWLDEQALHNTLDFSPGLERWQEMLSFVTSRD